MEHENILDHEEGNAFLFYANRSIQCIVNGLVLVFLTALGGIFFFFINLNTDLYVLILGLPLFGSFVCALYGCYAAVQSFRLKEPTEYKKIIGLIGNILLAGFFLLFLWTLMPSPPITTEGFDGNELLNPLED